MMMYARERGEQARAGASAMQMRAAAHIRESHILNDPLTIVRGGPRAQSPAESGPETRGETSLLTVAG